MNRPFDEFLRRDIRGSQLYHEAETLFELVRQPGTGRISAAADVHASPDGSQAVFLGTLMEKLEGAPTTRLCSVDLRSGLTKILSEGPNTDRVPKYSRDGSRVAFLSDRHREGDFQLYFFDTRSGATQPGPRVEGWVEYLHWSPSGRRVLLGVAGHGADVAGGQGAVRSKQESGESLSWMPNIESGEETFRWRSVWIYDSDNELAVQVSRAGQNVWEAVWCGDDAIAAVVSPGPGEGLWYSARLHVIDVESGESRELYAPHDQLGWPSASPSGRRLAVTEAVCSDRWIVAGDLRLLDVASGDVKRVNTGGLDITHTEWLSERKLLVAGHRGFEAGVALYDAETGSLREIWKSDEITSGARYIAVSGLGENGDCVLVGEGFARTPEIAVIRQGAYQAICSFESGFAERAKAIQSIERVTWRAPDGLEIQGWLLRPKGTGPQPLVMNVHGGPVGLWRPMWLGRMPAVLLLVERGYAVFLPNPRGSSGRGQDYARQVVGDLGGADARDLLSGLDHLVSRGVADPSRLGVTGGSYGGFMTSWLITQDSRFAAAVPLAPHNNQVTEYLISNIPHFVSMFLADEYNNPGGRYFQRSPINFAQRVRTPTLSVCGALDRCTPPEEAVQFHNALLLNGARSVLAMYPEEGHGIRRLPAAIDFAARMVAWFETYMPAG
jgi:dipeptidyl aminopeptidase/acylaminoacyl peptidase